jgi:phage shock protein PspC (stress-responsive transcriptional regulator)
MEEQNLHNELFGERAEPDTPAYPVKKLQRSADNFVIAGVCGGIAEYAGKDPAAIRLITAMMLILGAWIAAAYLIIAFLLPAPKHDESLTEEVIQKRKKENFRTVLSATFIVAGLHFALIEFGLRRTSGIFILPDSFMFPLLAVAAGVFLFTNKIGSSKTFSPETSEFFRTNKDKYLLGVCGGIAKYLGIDSSSLRIIFIILTGLTLGMFALAYLIIALAARKEPLSFFPHE